MLRELQFAAIQWFTIPNGPSLRESMGGDTTVLESDGLIAASISPRRTLDGIKRSKALRRRGELAEARR